MKELLEQYIQTHVAELAQEGAVYVLDRLRKRSAGKSNRTPNLGKIANDIFEKTGISRWSKPFVSMRSSCLTDLAEKFPIQVVTKWLGNSLGVAQKHYLKALPSHYEDATQNCAIFDKKSKNNDAATSRNNGLRRAFDDCAKTCAAHAGNGLQINETSNKKAANCSLLQLTANADNVQSSPSRTATESRKSFDDNGVDATLYSGGAKSGAFSDNGILSPDDRQALKTIISLWPELTPETKIKIMQTIEAVKSETKKMQLKV